MMNLYFGDEPTLVMPAGYAGELDFDTDGEVHLVMTAAVDIPLLSPWAAARVGRRGG